jgi:uncharacterized membrane protein
VPWGWRQYRVCGGAALALLGATSGANAEIDFCNKYPRTVFVAIAYQQTNSHWLSRGWLEVPSGQCGVFDTAIQVSTFYFRGATDLFPDDGKRHGAVKRHDPKVWGKEREFVISEGRNFQFYGAESHVQEQILKPFTQGPQSADQPVSAVVTFPADGSDAIITTK